MLQNAVDMARAVNHLIPVGLKEYYWAARGIYVSPALWIFLIAVLIWERLRPADPAQPLLSPALGQDFIWFNLFVALQVGFVPAFAGGLHLLYDHATGGRVLAVAAAWPTPLKIGLGLLIFDFLFWLNHWLMHRVDTLWHFHAIHHSQRELNVFTDRRVHIGELLWHQMLVFLPLTLLGLKPLAVMGVGTAVFLNTLFLHANIRTNLGWFRYVLVTPQYHRVHHSMDPCHRNRNFGSIITLWDWLFGTLHKNFDEYPASGIEGVEFPPPRSLKPQAFVADIARQYAYPFASYRGSRRRFTDPEVVNCAEDRARSEFAELGRPRKTVDLKSN